MEVHNYVAKRRAQFVGISKERVNIPYGTKVIAKDGFVVYKGGVICSTNSHNGRKFFSLDDDGKGLMRGALVDAILSQLRPPKDGPTDEYNTRWNRIWESLTCKRYRSPKHDDRWIWNQAFYEAPIEDLQSIAALADIRRTSVCMT